MNNMIDVICPNCGCEIHIEPPAQPEHNQNTPTEQTKTNKLGVKSGETYTDTISRQAAIDALDVAIKNYDEIAEECQKKADIERDDYMDMRDDAYEARQLAQWLNELKYLREKIEQLTIEPEHKTGEWNE